MIKTRVSNLVLTASLLLTSGLVQAQTASSKIGVINLQQAVMSTQDGQEAVARLQREMVEPRTKELETMQAEIQGLNDQLQRGGNTMSDTAKADLQRQIDAKTKLFNRAVEDYQADSEAEQRKVLDDLSQKMRTVIQTYVNANGYTVILDAANPNSGLVYTATAADITPAIIEAYNQSHPVAVSAAPAAPAAVQPGTPAPATAPPAAPAAEPAKP